MVKANQKFTDNRARHVVVEVVLQTPSDGFFIYMTTVVLGKVKVQNVGTTCRKFMFPTQQFLFSMTSVNGSSIHEAFELMATLLAPRVPLRYLELSGQLLQRRQMEEVFEERAAAKRCAFPACENPLPKCAIHFQPIKSGNLDFSKSNS